MAEPASNMTDVIAGLRVLSHLDRPERQEQLDRFYDKWKDGPLVIDKWLSLQATSKRENTIEDVKRLMQHEAFNKKNPNRIRALIGAFCMGNFPRFHAADGSGYKLLADFVIELDPVNPQIASRLVQAMIRWRKFDSARQERIVFELRNLDKLEGISENTREVIMKSLPIQAD